LFYNEYAMIIYVKLKDPSNTVYFQSIIGTYSHLAWTRTEDAKEGLIKIISTNERVDEVKELLRNLKDEIEFEEVKI